MLSYRAVLPLVALCLVAGENNAGSSMLKLSNNKKLRQSFNNLLNTVTNVNQERFDNIKKLYELQSYVPKASRSENKLVAVVIPMPKEKMEYLNDQEPLYRGTRGVFDIEDNQNTRDTSLRAYEGCNKKAAKYCKSACKQAIKDLCSEYKCQKSMKKFGKKVCGTNCKAEFGTS